MNLISKLKTNSSFRNYFALFIFATIGIVLMIVSTNIFPSSVDKVTGYVRKEKIILWFYFTFMSNVFGFFGGLFGIIGVFKKDSTHFQRFKIMMATNLTITFIVYWAILARTSIPTSNTFQFVSNIFVHALTPILAVFAFIFELKTNSFWRNKQLYKTSFINLIFPIIWFILAIIIFYSLGAHDLDAIYGFLNFNSKWWVVTIAVIAIAILYFWFTYFFAYLNRKLDNKR